LLFHEGSQPADKFRLALLSHDEERLRVFEFFVSCDVLEQQVHQDCLLIVVEFFEAFGVPVFEVHEGVAFVEQLGEVFALLEFVNAVVE